MLRKYGSKVSGAPRRVARYYERQKRKKQEIAKVAKKQITWMAEKKWYTIHTAVNIDFGGDVDWLTQIPQGDTDLTRDGDQLRLTSVSFKGNIRPGDATNTIRLIMFKWNDNNIITAPDPTDILTANGTGEAPLGMYQQDNIRARRLNIIFDKLYTVDTYNPQKVISFKKKLRGSPINFNGGGTTGRGHIYLMYISDSGAAQHATLNYAVKFVFTDH